MGVPGVGGVDVPEGGVHHRLSAGGGHRGFKAREEGQRDVRTGQQGQRATPQVSVRRKSRRGMRRFVRTRQGRRAVGRRVHALVPGRG